MNRLTFFKRLFNVAAVAAIAPKAEASKGLKINKDFKNTSPLDRIEYTPEQIEDFFKVYAVDNVSKEKYLIHPSPNTKLSINLRRL